MWAVAGDQLECWTESGRGRERPTGKEGPEGVEGNKGGVVTRVGKGPNGWGALEDLWIMTESPSFHQHHCQLRRHLRLLLHGAGRVGGKVREEVVAEAGERAKGGSPREKGLLQVSAGTM